MRKIISLMMVLVLGVVLVGSSVQALQHDPMKPRVDLMGTRADSGDDIGIDDPQTCPPAHKPPLMFFVFWDCPTVGFVIYDFVIDTAIESDDHGSRDNVDTEGSSGANPQ